MNKPASIGLAAVQNLPSKSPVEILRECQFLFTLPNRIKEPFPWVEHIPFAYFIVELLKPKLAVELGTHTGNSFNALCQAANSLKTRGLYYAVDTWQGEEHAGFYSEAVFIDVAEHFARYNHFAHLLRMTFDEALSKFSDGSIDLLHIDGLHTYEAVKHDFDSWLPKMNERGIVLLHDISERNHDFGVWRLWEEIKARFPTAEFSHGHGLGVAFVGSKATEGVGGVLLNFLNTSGFAQGLFQALGSRILALAEPKVVQPQIRTEQGRFSPEVDGKFSAEKSIYLPINKGEALSQDSKLTLEFTFEPPVKTSKMLIVPSIFPSTFRDPMAEVWVSDGTSIILNEKDYNFTVLSDGTHIGSGEDSIFIYKLPEAKEISRLRFNCNTFISDQDLVASLPSLLQTFDGRIQAAIDSAESQAKVTLETEKEALRSQLVTDFNIRMEELLQVEKKRAIFRVEKSEEQQRILNQNLADLNQRTSELQTELQTIREALHSTLTQRGELEFQLNSVINSKSWKITKPIRSIRALFRSKKS